MMVIPVGCLGGCLVWSSTVDTLVGKIPLLVIGIMKLVHML